MGRASNLSHVKAWGVNAAEIAEELCVAEVTVSCICWQKSSIGSRRSNARPRKIRNGLQSSVGSLGQNFRVIDVHIGATMLQLGSGDDDTQRVRPTRKFGTRIDVHADELLRRVKITDAQTLAV